MRASCERVCGEGDADLSGVGAKNDSLTLGRVSTDPCMAVAIGGTGSTRAGIIGTSLVDLGGVSDLTDLVGLLAGYGAGRVDCSAILKC